MSVAGNDTQLSPDVGSKKVGKWKDRRVNQVLSKHLRGGAGYNIAVPSESVRTGSPASIDAQFMWIPANESLFKLFSFSESTNRARIQRSKPSRALFIEYSCGQCVWSVAIQASLVRQYRCKALE